MFPVLLCWYVPHLAPNIFLVFCLTFTVIVLMQNDGVKCIAKEDELTYQMLRHGANSLDDYLIDISSVCLGPYELHFGQYSVAASAVMLVSACLERKPPNITIHPSVRLNITYELYAPSVKLNIILHIFGRMSRNLQNFVFMGTNCKLMGDFNSRVWQKRLK
jgi:hypothetical protein